MDAGDILVVGVVEYCLVPDEVAVKLEVHRVFPRDSRYAMLVRPQLPNVTSLREPYDLRERRDKLPHRQKNGRNARGFTGRPASTSPDKVWSDLRGGNGRSGSASTTRWSDNR